MSLGSDLRKVVSDLLRNPDFARSVTMRVVTRAEYEIGAGEVAETVQETALRALVSGFPREERRGADRIGRDVREGDLKLICGAEDVGETPPTTSTLWQIGADVWTTVKVDPQMAGDVVVFYTCQLRK